MDKSFEEATWKLVALAAQLKQERDAFQDVANETNSSLHQHMADQADWMLTGLEQYAGFLLHNDKTHFTWGLGSPFEE